MENIYILNDRKHRKSTKLISAFMGVLMIGLGIYITSVYGIVSGILLLFAGMVRKITVINEEGVLITYDARIYKYHELWAFLDIKELHVESRSDNTKKALHFTKGAMSKILVFDTFDADKVIKRTLEKNPNIHIDEVYYSK